MTRKLEPTDLASLPEPIRKIVEAARDLDRVMLDDVMVHPCDSGDDAVKRQKLTDEHKALSVALAEAGMTKKND